ncbi:Aldo/keto reductase [Trichoderma compactum]
MAPAALPTKPLGRNGPLVSTIGFGAVGLGSMYGCGGSDEERFKVLGRAHELGNTFWDTADVYGDSEELPGKWFKHSGKRDDIFLATKCGGVYDPSTGKASIRSDPEYVRRACDKSLQLLGVSHIDLFYLHRVDKETPVELTIKALAEAGEYPTSRSLRSLCCDPSACACRPPDSRNPGRVQPLLGIVDIEKPQIGVLSTARELGVAVVAYSPLGRGMLTGQIKSPDDFDADDFRNSLSRFSKETFPKKPCIGGNDWDNCHQYYLEENLGAVNVELSKDEDAEIRKAIDETEVVGGRYSDAHSDHLFADTVALESK